MIFKGSDVYKVVVIGDIVGDLFKDIFGLFMNIFIKFICLVGLVIFLILGGYSMDVFGIILEGEKMIIIEEGIKVVEDVLKEIWVEMGVEGEEIVVIVIIEIIKNGEIIIEIKIFKGIEEEVKV